MGDVKPIVGDQSAHQKTEASLLVTRYVRPAGIDRFDWPPNAAYRDVGKYRP